MIRDATDADLVRLYGVVPDEPTRLLALDYGRGAVAVGGVLWRDGQAWAMFGAMGPFHAISLLRARSRVREVFDACGHVLARRDPEIPCADRFLRAFGFVPADGWVYEYRNR